MKLTQKLIQEFKEKLKELQQLSNELIDLKEGDSRLVYFGYKIIKNDEIYTIPDWENIETFLTDALSQVEKETEKKFLDYIENEAEIDLEQKYNLIDELKNHGK